MTTFTVFFYLTFADLDIKASVAVGNMARVAVRVQIKSRNYFVQDAGSQSKNRLFYVYILGGYHDDKK